MPSQNEKSLRNESKEFYGLLVLSNGKKSTFDMDEPVKIFEFLEIVELYVEQ